MPTFNFVGVTEDEYPSSSQQISFGRGYQFATSPRGPDQILCRVSFPHGLWWFQDPATGLMNYTVNPTINIGALKALYEDVRMYKTMDFLHPHRGATIWRFSKPLILPRITDGTSPGGFGNYRTHQTSPFDVSLILQP